MKTWTIFILVIWVLLAFVASLPSLLLSDEYHLFARSGTEFTLKTSAVATFDSERFFAVEQSGEVIGAERKGSDYVLELHGVENDYWKVVRGYVNVNIENEVGSTFFEISLKRSFFDWFGSVVILFAVAWCFWVLGAVVILQW